MFHEIFSEGIKVPDQQNGFTMPYFIDILQELKGFENSFPEIAESLFTKKNVSKGEILVQEGELSKQFFFLEKGILRSYSMIANKERTIQLCFPCEFSGTYSNSVLGVPSDVTIQAISNSKIWIFDWDIWDKVKLEYPKIELFERVNSASYIMSLNERINDLLFLSTYERYEKLLRNRPQFIKKVPLKYIADFLGCTVENLSRIRAQIAR